MAAALEVGRQGVGWVRRARAVAVGQAGLAAVGSGQPAEEVVEGAVLHHDDDDVVIAGRRAGGARRGQPPSGQRGRAHAQRSERGYGAPEELATREGAIAVGAGGHRAVNMSLPKDRSPGAAA